MGPLQESVSPPSLLYQTGDIRVNLNYMTPVQWTKLSHIDAIEPIGESDQECLAEIRAVLLRHGKENRLGVALLHSHFDLAEDEVLLETCDKDARELTMSPAKIDAVESSDIGTIWMFGDDDTKTTSWCRQFCKRGIFGNHFQAHNKAKVSPN